MRILLAMLFSLSIDFPLLGAPKTVTLAVKGWTCGACATATRIALKRLDGVSDVRTDVDKKHVVVAYDDVKVTPARMIEAIGKLGYGATVDRAAHPNAPRPVPVAGSAASPPPVSLSGAPLDYCRAAGLGCGSFAKPTLDELAKSHDVVDVEAEPLSSKARAASLRDIEGGRRYGAACVDRGSEREARVNVARLGKRARGRLELTPDRFAALGRDLAIAIAEQRTSAGEYRSDESVALELTTTPAKYFGPKKLAEGSQAAEQGLRALEGAST